MKIRIRIEDDDWWELIERGRDNIYFFFLKKMLDNNKLSDMDGWVFVFLNFFFM